MPVLCLKKHFPALVTTSEKISSVFGGWIIFCDQPYETFQKALITSAVMQCKSLLSGIYCVSMDPIQNTDDHQNCVFVSSLITQLSGLGTFAQPSKELHVSLAPPPIRNKVFVLFS